MDKAFLYRRLAQWITCTFNLPGKRRIALHSKHHLSSFQDVFINPFYWECLFYIQYPPVKIIDIGANFGYFTSLASSVIQYRWPAHSCSYLLVEANVKLIKSIEAQLSDFGISGSAATQWGLAGPSMNKKFKTHSGNLMASKISEQGAEVPFIDFYSSEFLSPDLIKIDIEGAEFELFENYFNWIKSAQTIIIEFHDIDKLYEKANQQLLEAGFNKVLHRQEESGYYNCLYIKHH